MLIHPLKNKDTVITSAFGTRKHPVTGVTKLHNGVDLRAKTGTPVYSPADGNVTGSYYSSGGGNQLIIEHPSKDLRSGYAHLDRRVVSKGQKVRKGQLIAYTGATGAVTAAHLHFTLKTLGTKEYVDPVTMSYTEGVNDYKPLLLSGVILVVSSIFLYRYAKD